MKSLYDILGVPSTAPQEQIKRSYRTLARQLHPDVTGNDAAKTERFKEVVAAYTILSDDGRRAAYDKERAGYRETRASGSGFSGGPSIFGDLFDNLVNRVGEEGIGAHNLDDLLKDMVTVAKDVQVNVPKRVAQAVAKGTKTPAGILNLVEGIFDDVLDWQQKKKP